ncbi:MAG TPA: hypothetical protein VFX35_06335 [Solirubrobacterales bacterium]|nr:hypothetical protein [Solirubrobacterales bacterium]
MVLLALQVVCSGSALAIENPEFAGRFGPDGTEASDFVIKQNDLPSVAVDQQTGSVYVLDSGADAIYKFDGEGHSVDFGGSNPDVSGNKLSGLSIFDFRQGGQIAVDSESHRIYVTSGNSVVAFEANGDPALFTNGPVAGTNIISGFNGSAFGELLALGVDSSGNIYAGDYAGTVSIFKSSGEEVTRFTASTPGSLALAPDGSVLIFSWDEQSVRRYTPSEVPVTASTTYTPGPAFNSADFASGVTVDSDTGEVYLVESNFSSSWIAEYSPGGDLIRTFGKRGEPGSFAGYAEGIAYAETGEKLYVGQARSELFSKVAIFRERIPMAPAVLFTSPVHVTADSALLRAQLNPNRLKTTYYFEFGTDDCSKIPDPCHILDPANVSIGGGLDPVLVSLQLSGLESGTTYHYRVVAENALGITKGPDRSFSTDRLGLGFEPSDSRAWEMVSPPDKLGGEISGGLVQAEQSGDGLAFWTLGSIVESPAGSRAFEPATVLARRDDTGWSSRDLTVPHSEATRVVLDGEYGIFAPDLSAALLEPRDGTPLSPEATERTPYLRNTLVETGGFTPLLTAGNVSSGARFGGDELTGQTGKATVDGADADLSHIVLSSEVPLIEGADVPLGNTLYEWSAGELMPVSVLPAAEGGGWVDGVLGSQQGVAKTAISQDGSRVFWAPGNMGTAGINLTGLYMRDVPAEETFRLDVREAGVNGDGTVAPMFQGASADGSVVYFTDTRQLTADASPEGRDLYRCEIPSGASGCSTLTDLSAPAPDSGESGEQQGIVSGLSEDGSRVFFVARGVLDTEPNGLGETARAGKPNLYAWTEGVGNRFVATLSEEDDRDWGKVNGSTPGYFVNRVASASPSGRYLAFMSSQSLTGYDSHDAGGALPAEEVYRYDATTDDLRCVSCNPTGGSPEADKNRPPSVDVSFLWEDRTLAAALPESLRAAGERLSRYPVYAPRAMLDNGRVYFNAFDSLVPTDTNGKWDVYQYEDTGVGSCTASPAGAAMSRLAGGCVSLISSGGNDDNSAFLDSSTSGSDVFFLTQERLSVADYDAETDIYDARVNGVPERADARAECVGEACQPEPNVPPDPTTASSVFRGPGNVTARLRHRCPKGKHRGGRTRCKANKHRPRHHKKRAGHRGRAEK